MKCMRDEYVSLCVCQGTSSRSSWQAGDLDAVWVPKGMENMSMCVDLEIAMCLPALVTSCLPAEEEEGSWLAGLCFMSSVCRCC